MYIISPPRLMKRRGRVLWAMMRTQVGTSALVHWEIGGKRVFLEKKLERSCALSKSNQSSASGGYLCYFDFLATLVALHFTPVSK